MAKSELQGAVVPVKLWTELHEVESTALDQLKKIAALPCVFKHVAVMPDVHWGKGATVGSVIAMKGAIAPAAVGVDIGCGMAAVKTNLKAGDLPDSLKELRSKVERAIPTGYHENKDVVREAKLNPRFAKLFDDAVNLTEKVDDTISKAKRQVGTLGGGNHFIELCLDTEDNVWLMLHSGSRNIGKQLASIHMSVARHLTHNEKLPDKDLAYFLAGTPEMEAYRHDLFWAQEYAFLNREVMLERYQKEIKGLFPQAEFEDPILCHHNYVAEEVHFDEKVIVTRKGAIRAQQGDMGIIPGSMGTKSYIVRGKGNPEAFNSASHGAGRRMSRGQAKKSFTVEDLKEQTKGIECRKDEAVIDEIPGAYKDIDTVMANQSDLVEVVAELKQVMCIKGD